MTLRSDVYNCYRRRPGTGDIRCCTCGRYGSSGSDRRLLATPVSTSNTLISNVSSASSNCSARTSVATGDDGDDHDWDSSEASDGVLVRVKKEETEVNEGEGGSDVEGVLGREGKRKAGAD